MKKKALEEMWKDVEFALDSICVIRKSSRDAFFLGASALLSLQMEAAREFPPLEAIEMMEKLNTELEEYVDTLKKAKEK